MAVLVDTSGLVGLVDADDEQHDSVLAYFEAEDDIFVVPVTVLPEADYMVGSRVGAREALALLRAVAAGDFQLENLTGSDLLRSMEIMEQYADSNIGLVDASIVAVAERLRVTRILTLDSRHFRMFRPRHCASFELVP